MSQRTIQRALAGVDWNFRGSRKGYIAPLHWYPGTFVRGLSDTVIQALTKPGDLVIDPFGGIGTTAASAILNGRSVHSIDLNPVASLSAFVTSGLLLLAQVDRGRLGEVLGAIEAILVRRRTGQDLLLETPRLRNLDEVLAGALTPPAAVFWDQLNIGTPNWDALSRWIAPATLANLKGWHADIMLIPSTFARTVGLCMLSSNLRAASSQHASWGHLADNVAPKVFSERNLDILCARWLVKAKQFSRAVLPQAAPGVEVSISCADSRHTCASGEATLLLTSPPYAGAIDYALSQRLSMYFLGRDDPRLSALVMDEIGARRKRFQSTSLTTWSEGMCEVILFQERSLRSDGAICLVLPHKDSGRRLGEEAVVSGLQERGWLLAFEADRSIHQSHTRQSWTSIKQETLLFFARG